MNKILKNNAKLFLHNFESTGQSNKFKLNESFLYYDIEGGSSKANAKKLEPGEYNVRLNSTEETTLTTVTEISTNLDLRYLSTGYYYVGTNDPEKEYIKIGSKNKTISVSLTEGQYYVKSILIKEKYNDSVRDNVDKQRIRLNKELETKIKSFDNPPKDSINDYVHNTIMYKYNFYSIDPNENLFRKWLYLDVNDTDTSLFQSIKNHIRTGSIQEFPQLLITQNKTTETNPELLYKTVHQIELTPLTTEFDFTEMKTLNSFYFSRFYEYFSKSANKKNLLGMYEIKPEGKKNEIDLKISCDKLEETIHEDVIIKINQQQYDKFKIIYNDKNNVDKYYKSKWNYYIFHVKEEFKSDKIDHYLIHPYRLDINLIRTNIQLFT